MTNTYSTQIDLIVEDRASFIRDRKLKDSYFIGRFEKTADGYIVSDIRRSDFSRIKYKPGNAKTFTISVDRHLQQITETDVYYRFNWIMIESKPNYVFKVDTDKEIVRISSKEIVQMLFEDMYNYSASASSKIVNTLDTLKNQLTSSGKEVFIYELLQNANDYPQKVDGLKMPVDIEFHITDNYLIFQHSGDYFDAKNIAAICSINEKEKTDNVEAIGYKGIGFKTVFLDNNYVLLRTGEYQFRFDYEKTRNIEDTPWQILPIWTEDKLIDQEVLDVLDNADPKYRVQIALRPSDASILHDGNYNYEKLFSDVFETERVILFIPFVKSVSIYIGNSSKPSIVRIKENDKWCVSPEKKYVGDIPTYLTEELNKRIDKSDGKIPEKYYNFRRTSVGFACRREGRYLQTVENACLYCYLPAKKAKFGFGFLMNTDMIPTGPRDNVEPKENINHAIAKIAGEQFFHWIHDLLESDQYDYESIFGLIPNFEACKEKYEDDEDIVTFIEEFQEGFETCLQEEAIIPVEIDGAVALKPIQEINFDQTGISCANIISDEHLLNIIDWTDYFPHPSLRDTESLCLKPNIQAFLETYSQDNCRLDLAYISSSCEGKPFQDWIIKQDDNNKFIEFLLAKGFVSQFDKKKIFLTEDHELVAAVDIYEDIDEYYPNLVAFDDYLPRLSKHTRSYFKDNESWTQVKNELFAEFDPDRFVDNELCSRSNIGDTIRRLHDKAASIGFYDFLAKYVQFSMTYLSLPFIDFRNTVLPDFTKTIYFYNEDAEKLYDADWTDSKWINLVSNDYTVESLNYFKEHFYVYDFTISDFFKKVLLEKDARVYLNNLGEEHKHFIHFCYEHKELIKKNQLADYALWTYDKEGDNKRVLCEEAIFFSNSLMESFEKKSWIANNWMYQLDPYYYEAIQDEKDFKEFLSEAFGVLPFTQETFYKHVVIYHTKDICNNIGGTATDKDTDESIDVLTYLGENFKLIFEEDGNDRFIELPLYRYDVWDKVTDRFTDVYLYNDELMALIEANWTPNNFVYMLEERYSEVFTRYPNLRKKFNINIYSFKSIKDILLHDINSLRNSTKGKEENLLFHRFIHEHIDDLTKGDYKLIKQLPLYSVNGAGEEKSQDIDDTLYLSNAYMGTGKGIEAMVKQYDGHASFVSSEYIPEDGDTEDIGAWKQYFIDLGVSFDIKDIIFNSVLPNLSEIRDRNIPFLLAEYYDYFRSDDTWETCLKQLRHLNVVVKGGEDMFLPLHAVLFNDCDKTEPYPYLVIDNELARFYHDSPSVIRLIREIVESYQGGHTIYYRSFNTLDEWKKEKLDCYLNIQSKDLSRLDRFHTHFIRDLAYDYNTNYEIYSKQKVKEILLKGKDNKYHKPQELTEGSIYHPRCDFERFGIPLNYISEDYLSQENPDIRMFSKLYTDMGVIYDFHSLHIPYMCNNYPFSVYFWNEYLTVYANRTHITAINYPKPIADQLSDYATIPSSNPERQEVRKPGTLYSQKLIQEGFVKKMVRDYEDKMPLEAIFSTKEVTDILNKLTFANELSFGDCLECLLHTKDKGKRKEILGWLSTKHGIDHIKVDEYLNNENAVWKNGRGEFVHITELYLLDICSDRLRQLFGKNTKVMSHEYIDNLDVFTSFCRIFKVNALKEEDFILNSSTYDEPTTEQMRKILRLPLLITAAVSEPDKWESAYKDYCSKLDKLSFYRCRTISFCYDDVLSDSSIQYYKKGDSLYFVNDWMGRRVFKDLIFDIVDYFDIEMDKNMLEGIFEADEFNQGTIIEQYVSYEIAKNANFVEALRMLNATIAESIKVTTEEEEEINDEIASFGTSMRPERQDVELTDNDYRGGGYTSKGQNMDKPGDADRTIETSYSDENTKSYSHTALTADLSGGDEADFNNEDPEDSVPCEDKSKDDAYQGSQNTYMRSSNQYGSTIGGYSSVGNSNKSQTGEPFTQQDTGHNSNHQRDYEQSTRNYNADEENSYANVSSLEDNSRRMRRNGNSHRHNYMGYNPDETSQRPFNVGRQEPTSLETKEATQEEISRLSALLGRAFDQDSIADTNYLVRMRFYNSVKHEIGSPTLSEREFIEQGGKYIQTSNGKYVHRCSAKGGILYISPTVWNRLKEEEWVVCMYYGKKANQFLYIRTQMELMKMIDKDAVVIQVTGNDKGRLINRIYDSTFPGMNGNIYTMIRTIKTSGDDFIFNEDETNRNMDTELDADLL